MQIAFLLVGVLVGFVAAWILFRRRTRRVQGIEFEYLNGYHRMPKIEVDGHELNQMAVGALVSAIDRYVTAFERGEVHGKASAGFYEYSLALRDLVGWQHDESDAPPNKALEATRAAGRVIWKAGVGKNDRASR